MGVQFRNMAIPLDTRAGVAPADPGELSYYRPMSKPFGKTAMNLPMAGQEPPKQAVATGFGAGTDDPRAKIPMFQKYMQDMALDRGKQDLERQKAIGKMLGTLESTDAATQAALGKSRLATDQRELDYLQTLADPSMRQAASAVETAYGKPIQALLREKMASARERELGAMESMAARAGKSPYRASIMELINMLQQPAPRGYAEGGEIEIETEIDMESPTADGDTAAMDSGDYVIPVEAVRFFGTKFFNDLITKAMDAEE